MKVLCKTVIFSGLFIMLIGCKHEAKKTEGQKEITKTEVVKDSKAEILKNEGQQNNANCFTQKDIENLNLFFKSISDKNPSPSLASIDSSNEKFEKKDLLELKKLFGKESFDSYELKNDKSNCDDDLALFIYYREKYDDGDEIHYSEISRMYKLTKTDGLVQLKFLSIAG
ncbi:hypothetical protein ACSTS3_15140 [Aquimarina muelleri]|uniref:hypothetical protein n=1 Tax=Aquimarina muelleri TaxID=279356 RepID=UPI003F6874FB